MSTFPPHLSNVTLYFVKLIVFNARARATIIVKEKTPEFIPT